MPGLATYSRSGDPLLLPSAQNAVPGSKARAGYQTDAPRVLEQGPDCKTGRPGLVWLLIQLALAERGGATMRCQFRWLQNFAPEDKGVPQISVEKVNGKTKANVDLEFMVDIKESVGPSLYEVYKQVYGPVRDPGRPAPSDHLPCLLDDGVQCASEEEKYLKKKAQKHVQQVTLLRPTIMELCETYYRQSRGKVCGLRYDYLSSLLCHADVRSGARFLVLDNAAGLVTGAMALQLGGAGEVFRAFRGGCPEKGLIELDLSEKEKATVRPVALEALQSSDLSACEWLRTSQGEDAPADPAVASRQEARAARVRQRREAVDSFKGKTVDGLVIVAGDDDAELAAE
ncbi:trmt6, partial [Symbiodinium sp. CCMP2592]